jgi:radical SAM protein (TIGR01212 family)
MVNPMNYINNQHKYYTLDFYLQQQFQTKVFKVSLNGNFSCPNRDGTISHNGCFYCSEKGSGDFAGDMELSLKEQFDQVRTNIHKKWPEAKYIAYFQANTNTYGPLDKLKSLFEEAITLDENIVALSIATRPDCLNDEIIEYLGELNNRIPVWVEIGLQTIHEKTAKAINRGHDLQTFNNAVIQLRQKKIEIIVHIINGLPGETKPMMIDTLNYINKIDIQGLKIHSLFLLKNTILGEMYLAKPWDLLTMEEYVDIVTEQLALLKPNIVIHRINGDAPKELLIAPLWGTKKFVVMNEIDKLMKTKKYYQGILYHK